MLDFAGRVAIVTGAGRGMGRSHAIMLASRGARVVVNDLPSSDGGESAAEQVVREITAAGGIAVLDHHSVVGGGDDIVRTAVAAFGRLDIVVCNAGVISSATFAEANPGDWETVFDIHFQGTVGVCRAAWAHLVRSGTGRIITTASSGMLGNAGLSSYGAAKGATFALTRSLAIEGQDAGITANCILPSAWTRITGTIDDPAISASLQKYFQPEHVSALVTWLAHQDTAVTNEVFQVSGGRAGRLVMAAYPTVRIAESTPETWQANSAALLADGPLGALRSTAEMFGDELADADPAIRHAMDGATGGLGLKPTTGREGDRLD
jgi:NAD(P)-dependent dehydrogenase (short-subunit alcohol dehydrogenase family)